MHNTFAFMSVAALLGFRRALEDRDPLDRLAWLVLKVLAELSPCSESSLIGCVLGKGVASKPGQASDAHGRRLICDALLKLKARNFIRCAQAHIAITDEGRRALRDGPVAGLQPHQRNATELYAQLSAFASRLRTEHPPRLRRLGQACLVKARAIAERELPVTCARALGSAGQVWSRSVAPRVGSTVALLDHVLVQFTDACRSRAGASAAVREILKGQIGVVLSKVARASGAPLYAKLFAGALLLACGALSIAGSGVVSSGKLADGSRAGVTKVLSDSRADVERASPIVWLHDGQNPSDRSILVTRRLDGATLIEGLAIRGENASDQKLTGVEGVIKTDSGEEMKLGVSVEGSEGKQADAQDVPSGAKFTLEAAFQGDAGGEQVAMPAEEFLSTFGGMILRVSCTVAGAKTTLIEYFSASRLRAQLADASQPTATQTSLASTVGLEPHTASRHSSPP